ncbi:MAG TPA: histidine kinase [Terriglobia bacterium]|nr:histidine kinase [Terriglobia bacterium]
MAESVHNPTIKAGFEIVRDSLLLAAGLTLLVMLFSNSVTPVSVAQSFAVNFTYTLLIMFLAYAIMGRVWQIVCDWDDAAQWFVFVVGMIVISGIGSALGSAFILITKIYDAPLAEVFWQSFKICAVVSLIIGVSEVQWDRLKGQLEDTRLKLRTEELERERAMKLATEARLGALESRLHPHFLFNTLNSISSLIPTDPVRAERMVERMAGLLRFTLDSNQGGLVAFDQELKIVRDYLEIEQARLGGRLRWGLETRGDMEGLKVPPLSIQTLVENSIKYAVAPNREGGEVRVSAERNNGFLRVNVADTGQGFTLESMPAGHGLDILRSRLDVLFGESADLSVTQLNGWTTVSMKVPA